MLKKGDKIDQLTFKTSTGHTYDLEALKEHKAIVFFFYPKDFTSGCTKEVCHFRDFYSEIREAGGAIFGISLDDDASHEAFRDKHTLPYELISDKEKTLSRQFGVLRLGGLLLVRRATFVINPQTGEVVDAFSSELNMNVHADRALESIKALTDK